MLKYTIKVSGMKCPHCEAKMCDALKSKYPVKKVNASHENNEVILIMENEVSDEELKTIVNGVGYRFGGVSKEPYKKFLFF